jgi:hypothetical protein
VISVSKETNPDFDEDRFKARIEELRTEFEGLNHPTIDSPTGFILTLEQRKKMMFNELWELGHQELVEAMSDHTLSTDKRLDGYQEYFDALNEEEQVETMKQLDSDEEPDFWGGIG